jgi:hypothetical protein
MSFPELPLVSNRPYKGHAFRKIFHPDGEVRSIPGIDSGTHQMPRNALRMVRMQFV